MAFGRKSKEPEPEPIMQDCGSCQGMGFKMVQKTDKKGNSVEQDVECGTCKGTGQVKGGSPLLRRQEAVKRPAFVPARVVELIESALRGGA